MKIEDAFRKIRLLRQVTPERGASNFEAETATRLARTLMDRYCVASEDVRPTATPRSRMTWVYWEALLEEFDITLNRFGRRANASFGNGALVVIRLAAEAWHVQELSPQGWKITVRDHGLESLRAYLTKHRPRTYSLAG